MQIYRYKCALNNNVTTINTHSKSEIFSPSNITHFECQTEHWRRKKYNEVTALYQDGYAYYHCEYVIGPFLLCMYLMHDFKKQITYINQFKLFHKYLNISISKVILIINEQHTKGISKYEINFLISNKANTIHIERKLELTITVRLNEKLDEYFLNIHIIKASSILQHKIFVINNIFNNYDILKYLLCDILTFLPNEILTIICNQFLSKYFWIFPAPFIHHSLALHQHITDDLPFQYQLYYGYSQSNLLKLSQQHTYIQQVDQIENVKYVEYNNLSQSTICNINGIGIEIEIDDENIINSTKYPQLFDVFSKNELIYPQLSTIFPFKNPSTLYKLKSLYEEIERYCMDKIHLIRVNAKLLIDRNVDSKDIAMLWINWRPLHKEKESDDWLNQWDVEEKISIHNNNNNNNNFDCYQHSSITHTYQLAIELLIFDGVEYEKNEEYNKAADVYGKLVDIFNENGLVDKEIKYLHKMAQILCRFDFEKSVCCYQKLMQISDDYRCILYVDEEHCGEPMIAMERIEKENELIVEKIFNKDKKKIIIDKYTKLIKKGKNKSKFECKRNNRMRYNKYPKMFKRRMMYYGC